MTRTNLENRCMEALLNPYMLAFMYRHIPYLPKPKMARRGKHAHELNMHDINTKHKQKMQKTSACWCGPNSNYKKDRHEQQKPLFDIISTRQKLMMRIRAVFEVQLLPARNLLASTKIYEQNFDTNRKASRKTPTSANRFSGKLSTSFLVAIPSLTKTPIKYR